MKTTLSLLALAATVALPSVASADTLRMAFSSAPRSLDPYPFGGAPTQSKVPATSAGRDAVTLLPNFSIARSRQVSSEAASAAAAGPAPPHWK